MISVTTVVEHVFCPKFTYYGMVLGIEQYEQKRGTVLSGRAHHATSEKTNKDYVPQNITGEKITSLKLYSKKYGFVGIVDHCIVTDSEIILIERKYTDYKKIHDTLRVQLGLLAVLLEENLEKPVQKALVIFSKDATREQIPVTIDSDVKQFALDMLKDAKKVMDNTLMPKSHYDRRCINCCYRNVCDVGSLNSI